VTLADKFIEGISAMAKGLALITGASSGIGFELAKVFAAEGYDLIVSSRDAQALESAKASLAAHSEKANITAIAADLATVDGARKLHDAARKVGDVDILVNNAGIGVWGPFAETELSREMEMLQVNVASLVALTKRFVPDFIKRGKGKLLFTASEASLVPLAFMAVYAATKAFIYHFALALREELKDENVTVTAVLPGMTATNFFKRADMLGAKMVQEGDMADPTEVARAAFDALMAGDDHVVTPLKSRVQGVMAKLMPDGMAVERAE
jgi:short-subunit dehydrogenase